MCFKNFLIAFFLFIAISNFLVASPSPVEHEREQLLLNSVVAQLGKHYFLLLNNSNKHHYPLEGESAQLNDTKLINYASDDKFILKMAVGVDGKNASACIDEFFEAGGVIDCAAALSMVMLAIWRDLLGEQSFSVFIADVKDRETFSDYINAFLLFELEKQKLALPQDENVRLQLANRTFHAFKFSLRSELKAKLTDTITLGKSFFAVMTTFMKYEKDRGLLKEISKDNYAITAPEGVFTYFSNLSDYVKYHPDGNDRGMNGLVIEGQKFIGFSPSHCNEDGLDASGYERMHYESLILTPPKSPSETFDDFKKVMEAQGGAVFKRMHSILNLDTNPEKKCVGKFVWVSFDFQSLLDISGLNKNAFLERLHQIKSNVEKTSFQPLSRSESDAVLFLKPFHK